MFAQNIAKVNYQFARMYNCLHFGLTIIEFKLNEKQEREQASALCYSILHDPILLFSSFFFTL